MDTQPDKTASASATAIERREDAPGRPIAAANSQRSFTGMRTRSRSALELRSAPAQRGEEERETRNYQYKRQATELEVQEFRHTACHKEEPHGEPERLGAQSDVLARQL